MTLRLLAVGADPEVFFSYKGVPMSAEGIVGGSKAEPKKMTGLPDGFLVQEDNVAAEYNIPPAKTAKQFAANISRGLKYLEKIATRKGLDIEVVSALNFPPEQLMTRHAQTLGCEPDFNIWTEKINPKPVPPETLRTAAGHVHISWLDPTIEEKVMVGKACDVFLGLPSLLVTDRNERRSLYGKAGCVRIKDYGLEYRTLDNFWIANERHCQHVFDQVDYMFNELAGYHPALMDAIDEREEQIVETINNHDKDAAIVLMKAFKVNPFPMR